MIWDRSRLRAAIANVGTTQLVIGGYTLCLKGVQRFNFRDSYHALLALSWPGFLLTLLLAHAGMNVLFALLYWLQAGAVANAAPGSFLDCFFFSLETWATVGYGDMHPVSLYGHTVAGVEMLVSMAFTALLTGLLFVRFARPKANIRYADNAVVASHAGQPTLMIRIANGRRGLLYNAEAHLNLLLTRVTAEREVIRRVFELRLARSRLPIFSMSWVLMHRIDETSPLHGYDAAKLAQHDARLLLGVEAHDTTVSAEVVDMKSYDSEHILFGRRYGPSVSLDALGRPLVDLTAVGNTEPDVGPEPEFWGWEDRNWRDSD
jgi:inward rectifier potassium channel